jgi:hypothetical protein
MKKKRQSKISKNQAPLIILLTIVLFLSFTSIKLFIDNSILKQSNISITDQSSESTTTPTIGYLLDEQTISVDNGIASITGSAGKPITIDTELLKEDGVLRLLEIDTASTQDINKISPENIFTAECGYITQKPKEVTLTCADGGILVTDIRWEYWRASGASGLGIYSVNSCDPDCATGTRIEIPVQVKLSRLMTDGDNFYLTSFNAFSLDGQVLEMGWTFPWEFSKILLDENGSIATPFLQ